MSEKIVVVVGSIVSAGEYEPNYFWVIDFSNVPAEPPSPVQVLLPFQGSGCVVDCSGTLAAVGNSTGPGIVTIYDISDPAVPRYIGDTGAALSPEGYNFNGIGAISFYAGYVLAAEANGRRVALIEMGSLQSPDVYETGLDTLADVAIFGQYAVFCGTSVYKNAFQVANVNSNSDNYNLPSLQYAATTSFSDAVEYSPAFCDFDGVNAVFSDGTGVYVFGISDGTPTASPVVPSGGELAPLTSVTIAESQNAEGVYSGGVMTAWAGPGSQYVNLSFFKPPTPEANVFGTSASLGDLPNTYGSPNQNGAALKFSRTINGTSALLATAGVTQTASGVQEYVVSLFNVSTAYSHGHGSIDVTQQGQSAIVQLRSTLDATIGIATFYTFPVPPFPVPFPHRIEEL
jgi:hypothetical protein